MKFEQIRAMAPISDTDPAKVAEIAESIKADGWKGAPILVCNLGLVTGSHRLAALSALEVDEDCGDAVFFEDVAEDVTDIVNDYCERTGYSYSDIVSWGGNLRNVFAGTWVEEYAGEIEEW